MNRKKAFITGITGQDGHYLTELLLAKGYEVHGLKRHASLPNTERLEPFLDKIYLHEGDLTDMGRLLGLLKAIAPDEVYNLAAQSDVYHSFESPEYTAQVNALGPLRLLEALRLLNLNATRFYQASTSELFGKVQEIPQKETTPFHPRSPYACAKLYAYWITRNYREAYGIYAANGILFNHESPVRGEHFVTRKITQGFAKIYYGLQKQLYLGNIYATRDWGHARDAVEMQWLVLQQEKPDDYVIATGEEHSVKEFVSLAAASLGVKIAWEGEGLQEKAVALENCGKIMAGQTLLSIDPKYFRPAEVERLCGDARKAKEKLGFSPRISFAKLVEEMVHSDVQKIQEKSV